MPAADRPGTGDGNTDLQKPHPTSQPGPPRRLQKQPRQPLPQANSVPREKGAVERWSVVGRVAVPLAAQAAEMGSRISSALLQRLLCTRVWDTEGVPSPALPCLLWPRTRLRPGQFQS